MQVDLSGKVAIVTGAGQGIGEEIAHTFARAGAKVVIATRGSNGAAVAEAITKSGATAWFSQTDVGHHEQVRRVVAATVERSGLWRAFTPQAFPLGALLDALENAARDGQAVTDEAGAMEALGWQPRLVRGHGDNIKVTLPEDLPLAEAILRARMGD